MTRRETMSKATHNHITFTDDDVVNPSDFIPAGEFNPHNVRPFLLHDHGFVLAVVFADCLQDALEEAADAGKLDHLQIHPEDPADREDYLEKDVVTPGFDANCPEFVDKDGGKWWWREGCEPTFLGNAGQPFDLETVDAVEIPNPPFSFVALFNARNS